MNLSAELELVPFEKREQVKESFMNLVERDLLCNRLNSRWWNTERPTSCLNITFITKEKRKIVQIQFVEEQIFKIVEQQAEILFPNRKWRMFCGFKNEENIEFTNSEQLRESIRQSPMIGLSYLFIRLERSDHDSRNCSIS
ncbi:hypothetical protein GCK72_019673 [Caenorhabditis remanei]|uniref:Uncharacterized protein n=1 Tax=Caenorhabditis remanei TaxID=31234 RepID=A0A6A5GCZ4_CAERE|nr:hypothetical protein GCK72_019673 [Caenorhabditis remanei]KAF1753117.1 hypothetical protein GCK72_019673 [Caenorhabditis remanei]